MKVKNIKKDKGFSLVELIITVVILGIVLIVSIGGLYRWVNKSRLNTDIANARVIKRALGSDFCTSSYWTSGKLQNYLKSIGWEGCEKGDKNTISQYNNGNAIYIVRWNQSTFNDFINCSDYGIFNFPTDYNVANSKGNRGWFIFKYLAPKGDWEGIPTQRALDEVPVAKTPGLCFYLVFLFNEDGYPAGFDCILGKDEGNININTVMGTYKDDMLEMENNVD